MATGSSEQDDDGPVFPALIPRQVGGEPSDELRLLWRALLVVSGDAVVSEAALVAAVEACRPWSDRPDRLTIWLAGFDALEAEQQRTDVQLLGKPDDGPRASDIKAITEYLNGLTPARRRMLIGHHVGALSAEDLKRFVADGADGEDLPADQLTDWVDHDSKAAAQVLLIKPQHWIDVLSLLQPPVRPERLIRADARPWRSGATVGGLAIAVLLFLALFSLDRGSPPVADDQDETSISDGEDGASAASESAAADVTLECPAPDLALRVRTSPVYQNGLEPRAFTDVLNRADAVVRGAVSSMELANAGVWFELQDPQLLFGAGQVPTSFLLNARFDATGGAVPNGVLFPDAVVFLNEVGDRWEVAEAGGFWVSCEEDSTIAVGADWPTGTQWPDVPTPAELARVIDETLQENAQFTLTPNGERTVGGFQTFDGQTVVLQLPSGMQPQDEMSVVIRPEPDVLAVVGGPDLRLVLRQEVCDPLEQSRSPFAVCSSDGEVSIEIASPVELSDAWLGRIDVFTVSDETRSAGLVMRATRSGEVVAIDPAASGIVWRAPLRPDEVIAAAGASEVAVLAETNLRMLDAATGRELWGKKITQETGAVPVGGNWLVAPLGVEPLVLQLVDGATGEVLWRTDPGPGIPTVSSVDEDLVLVSWWDGPVRHLHAYSRTGGQLAWVADPDRVADRAAQTLLVDQERRTVVTVADGGTVRLIELVDGRTRWTTSIPSATSIDGIWLSTMTVNSSAGRLITINLADGFILPP
jgi:hypothetical protein